MVLKIKTVKRLLRRPFEWAGIFIGIAIFSSLSRKWMLRTCDFVSAVMYRLDDKGRRRSLANLRVICGKVKSNGIVRIAETFDPSKAEEKIIRRSYRNMARTVGHAFWTCRNAAERVRSAGEMSAEGSRFLSENNPAVTVSGHIGCWEILSQLAFLEGHRMMSVAKDIGTGGMTRLLMKARTSIGQEIVHANGAFRPLMQGLKDGKSLGLLVDQVVDVSNGGVWVRFFGVPIPVSAAPAFFSAKGKAPIVVAWSRPLKDGRYRCEVVATYTPDEARDIRGMTQRCIWDLERVIRRHPSAFVLNYNFFRNVPAKDVAFSAKSGDKTICE